MVIEFQHVIIMKMVTYLLVKMEHNVFQNVKIMQFIMKKCMKMELLVLAIDVQEIIQHITLVHHHI